MGLKREEKLERVMKENNNLAMVCFYITYDSNVPHRPSILGENWAVVVQTRPRLAKGLLQAGKMPEVPSPPPNIYQAPVID